MQSIMRDMSNLQMDKKNDNSCFLDLVGADVDGTFRDSLTYQQSASVAEISIAGQAVTSGNIQLAFRDEGVLLNLDKTCVCFEVTYNVATNAALNIPFNALYLFRPISCQLGGSLVWSLAQGEHYIQQKLLCKKKDQVSAQKIGLHMPLGPTDIKDTDYVYGTNNPVYVSGVLTQKQRQIQMMAVKVAGTAYTFRCAIPLAYLFPEVRQTFQDGFVYIGNGQHLIMNLMIVDKDQIIGHQAGTGDAYATIAPSISGAQLVKVYSKLDGYLINQIQKSSLSLHKTNVTNYVQPLAQSVVFNINLNKQERLKYLYFAISPSKQSARGVKSDFFIPEIAADSYVGKSSLIAAQSLYHNSLFRTCKLMQINFGGHTFTLNQQVLASMLESLQDEYIYAEDHPYMQMLFIPFKLDVSRFGIDKYFGDEYGSSSGNQMSAQISLIFEPGNVLLTYASSAEAYNGSNYTVRMYTESQTEASCENGIYKNVA